MSNQQNKSLILLCTGLGRVQRGFEMYISSLAAKLAQTKELEGLVEVWSGSRIEIPGVKTKPILNAHRSSWFGKRLGSKAFLWEQRTFFLGMLPYLHKYQDAVFYLGEYQLYCYLYKFRQVFGLQYSLVLYTGGQAIPGLFNAKLDYIHHVTNVYLDECKHLPKERQWVLPHFIEEDFIYSKELQKAILQKANGKKIVLSVGMLDREIKRMDLLIEALSPLAANVYPVLLGQYTADTDELRNSLEMQFGNDGFTLNNLPHSHLGNWYAVADLFVLCSPKESFGLAIVEALYHGLPVICADFPEARFVLGSQGQFVDMVGGQELSNAIQKVLQHDPAAEEKKQYALQYFTWSNLKKAYLHMFHLVLNNQDDKTAKTDLPLVHTWMGVH